MAANPSHPRVGVESAFLDYKTSRIPMGEKSVRRIFPYIDMGDVEHYITRDVIFKCKNDKRIDLE